MAATPNCIHRVDGATVTSPISFRIAVLKLLFFFFCTARGEHIQTWGWSWFWYPYWIWLRTCGHAVVATCEPLSSHILKHSLKKKKTNKLAIEAIKTLRNSTSHIKKVRSRVIFSSAYMETDFFLQPAESPLAGSWHWLWLFSPENKLHLSFCLRLEHNTYLRAFFTTNIFERLTKGNARL